MSTDATIWAWKQKVKPNAKLVLLSLADRADENFVCFPSIKRLVADTGIDRKTVIKYLDLMEQLGLIFIERRGGKSNLYVLKGVEDRVQSYPQPVPDLGQVGAPKTGQVSDNGVSQKRDRGCPKNGTGGVPKTGQGVSQKRDTEPTTEPITEPKRESNNTSLSVFSFAVTEPGTPDIPSDLFDRYVKHLSGKGVKVTQSLINGVMREAMLAKRYGFTPSEVLEIAIDRGWVRLKAFWFDNVKKHVSKEERIAAANQQAVDDFLAEGVASEA